MGSRKQKAPIVSIVTPVFNAQGYLQSTYHSILNQDMTSWEWICVDDCSTDGSLSMLRKWASEDARVKVFANPRNLGAAKSRNLAMDHARGVYLAFLDSDDLWLPGKLTKQLSVMRGGARFSSTAFLVSDTHLSKQLSAVDTRHHKQTFDYHDLLKKVLTCGCSTVMVSSDLVKSSRMPMLRRGQDYAFWLSLLRGGEAITLLSEPLTVYRVRPGSLSRNKFKKMLFQWKIYRQLEKLNLRQAIWAFLNYVKNALIRK